jgi:chemotaxis response regulator CheB
MAGRDIVVIGASAGGIRPLKELLALLPGSLPAALFVVVHRALPAVPAQRDFLPDVLRSVSKLPVIEATSQSEFRLGCAYVAPPRARLAVEGDLLLVEDLPEKTASHRTIDELFRSAARSHGDRVVAILLSGMLDDGSSGLREVSRRGGLTIVQDPANALEPSMPHSAMKDLSVHYCLKPPAIAQTVTRVCRENIPKPVRQARLVIVEDERVAALNLEAQLKDLGYEIAGSVGAGEEAVSLVAEARPDAVLMDVHLAGSMTGTEAGRVIWERHHIPVVYVTAYSDQQTVIAATRAMPYGFVVKPFRAAQVHAALQLALDRRVRELQAGDEG